MAKYKGREVTIIREFPNTAGDQVLIEHKELLGQTEMVPKTSIVMTKEEKADWDKKQGELKKDREQHYKDNDFRVEGVNDETATPVPTANEVRVQRQAEDNLERAEEQAKENQEWQKKHPNLPATAKQQLDAIKVVPYRDEEPKAEAAKDKTWYGKEKK